MDTEDAKIGNLFGFPLKPILYTQMPCFEEGFARKTTDQMPLHRALVGTFLEPIPAFIKALIFI